jgi:hypothetical protein
MTVSSRSRQGICELVEFDLVRVLLGRVWPGMTHQRLQCDEVSPALAKETVSEAMTQLVRRESTYPGAVTDAPMRTSRELPDEL